jgi:hypothetical protein
MAFDFYNLLDESKAAFEKIGLYAMSAQVGAVPAPGQEMEIMSPDVDIDEVLREGKADFFLVMTLRVGNVAWSDRVLRPEEFEAKQEFEQIVPTELEMLREEARRAKKEWEEGWDDL